MNICLIGAGRIGIVHAIAISSEKNTILHSVVDVNQPAAEDLAKKYSAQVPFVRPVELSNDHVGTIPVIKHAIEWIENEKNSIDNVCCLYATAPFLRSQIISKAFHQLNDSKSDYCFSVTSFPFPIQRAIRVNQDNKVDMFYPENRNTRSQDLEEAYHDAGQFYWGKAQAFKDELPFFSKAAIPYILQRYLVQDIDTLEDWKRAELMYQIINMEK